MKLFYTIDAVEDLNRLREFIATHDPSAAARISKQLIEGINRLSLNAEIGRRVPRGPDSELIRDLVIGHCLARYLLHKETIVILRIWHQREDRKNKSEDFPTP